MRIEIAVYIKNEYETLMRLNQYRFDSLIISNIFQSSNVDDKNILFQEDIFRGASNLKNKLNPIITDASIELSNYTRQTGAI